MAAPRTWELWHEEARTNWEHRRVWLAERSHVRLLSHRSVGAVSVRRIRAEHRRSPWRRRKRGRHWRAGGERRRVSPGDGGKVDQPERRNSWRGCRWREWWGLWRCRRWWSRAERRGGRRWGV